MDSFCVYKYYNKPFPFADLQFQLIFNKESPPKANSPVEEPVESNEVNRDCNCNICYFILHKCVVRILKEFAATSQAATLMKE